MTRRFHHLVLLVGVALLLLAPPSNATAMQDGTLLSKAEDIALQVFRDTPGLIANPNVLPKSFDSSFKKEVIVNAIDLTQIDAFLFILRDPTAKPGDQFVVAVDLSNRWYAVLYGPSEFQNVVNTHLRPGLEQKEVAELFRTCVRLYATNFPGAFDWIVILKEAGQIPGLKKDELARLESVVKLEHISNLSGGFEGTFFSWSDLGGDLVHWQIRLTKEGGMDVKRDVVAKGIGTYYLPK
jgi:hypothetical protein